MSDSLKIYRFHLRLWGFCLLGLAISLQGSGYLQAQFSDFKPENGLRVSKLSFESYPAPKPATNLGKSSSEIQAALEPLLQRVSSHVVLLESTFGRTTLGTIVSSEGLIIGKRSELTRSMKCTVNGQTISGAVVATHTEYDLALIVVDPTELPSPLLPIRFTKEEIKKQSQPTGKFVVSFTRSLESAKLGTISVRTQKFPLEQAQCVDCVNLGAVVSNYQVQKQVTTESGILFVNGLVVQRVYPRTASERCGLLVDDVLYSVNGKLVSNQQDLYAMAKNLRVGQNLQLAAVRNGKRLNLSTIINRLSPRMPHDLWGGGPFNEKRFGFTEVLIHDSVIGPADCGGPLFGLKGEILGINIARSMRVATFAVTLEKVHSFIKLAKPNSVLLYGERNTDGSRIRYN